MKQPISPKTHGIIDYTTSSAVMMAPHLLDMPKRASVFAYGLAGGLTAMSLLTKNPTGAKKVVPFKAHGAADLMLGAALPFVPRMLGLNKKKGSARNAQYFFCGLAAFTGLVTLMTDWNSPKSRGQRGG